MKKFIFCVDSDGCAMDTMTIKHELLFAPIASEIFEVKEKSIFFDNWQNINLYSRTRGVNRFIGLVETLKSIDYSDIDNLKKYPPLSFKNFGVS